jgi:hypothetical protein
MKRKKMLVINTQVIAFGTALLFSAGVLSAATYTVTHNGNAGAGSLRWAMAQAENNINTFDVIDFNIPGGGVQTIRPLTQLPVLTDTAGVFIDGLSQPGASPGTNPPSSCTLMIEVNGAFAGASHGFWILSPNNTIQGLVIDSFEQHGIRIQGIPSGTYNNTITLNWVGMDPTGTIIRGNGWNTARFWGGIYIEVAWDSIGFAFDNIIDLNMSSGNYAEGIGISSCPPGDVYQNIVTGNYVGTDYTGTLDCGNIHDGVYIGEGAHDNIIDGNLIAGNDFEGVCIVGYPPYGWDSHNNILYNNIIGLDIALNPLANSMDGVSIGQYGNVYQGGFATGNIIDSNIVAHNLHNGVTVWEHGNSTINCDHNWITQNTMYNNGALGIDLFDDGVTPNDANDPDNGPNEEVNFPIITGARYFAPQTIVDGTIDIDTDPTQATVEVFRAHVDPSGYGEGWLYLGATTPDAAGQWTATVTGLNIGDDVTATTTDMNMNTSEFAQNTVVVLGIEEGGSMQTPDAYMLEQNLPNPFTSQTIINYALPEFTSVDVSIYDVAGKKIITLIDASQQPGYHTIYWDGQTENGTDIANGVYFYRIATDNFNSTKKLIIAR